MNTQINALKAHLALNVRDVEKSIDFYRNMFELEPSKVRTGYAKFDISNPPLNLTLNQVSFGERGALSHLGIQVASTGDVNAVRDAWEAKGLTPRDEKQTTCCYALQDKSWVNDPDGKFLSCSRRISQKKSRVRPARLLHSDLHRHKGYETECCAGLLLNLLEQLCCSRQWSAREQWRNDSLAEMSPLLCSQILLRRERRFLC